jgi:hypothetical protein
MGGEHHGQGNQKEGSETQEESQIVWRHCEGNTPQKECRQSEGQTRGVEKEGERLYLQHLRTGGVREGTPLHTGHGHQELHVRFLRVDIDECKTSLQAEDGSH